MCKYNDRAQITANGFTLIEVLISLALLVIILGAIYNSFFTVDRAFERFNDVSLRYHEARTALEIMRREIEAALFKNTEQDEERTRFVIRDRDIFGKTTSEFQLATLASRNDLPVVITYFIEKRDEDFSLVKGILPIVPSDARRGEDGRFKIEIINHIEGFTVETLYNDRWVKTWDTSLTERLPEIVRITIEFNDNGRRVRLTEYARPMIGRRL